MNRLLLATFTLFLAGGYADAQSSGDLLKEIRKIKLLESTRDDVKQILYLYEVSNDDHHYQTFSNDDVKISINYSDGSCTDDPDADDEEDVWNVEEWKVTRIEISWYEPIRANEIGIDLKKFKKEQMYRNDLNRHLYYDKAKGIAVELGEDGVEQVILLPSRSRSKQLCKDMTAMQDFYSRDSWFSEKLEDRFAGCVHNVANVVHLELSALELDATSTKRITVSTTAVDPENDVLTFKYFTSAGTIIGVGARVVWDLTGVSPGTYTITAGVDDGCGICGLTKTMTLVVK